MNVLNFIYDNWDIIAVIVIIVIGVVIRLRSLWKGDVVEWLVAICADAETLYGDGTGYLKLRYVYNAFLATFPVLSKYISFETFSKWVDIALDKLKAKLSANEKLNSVVKPVLGGIKNVEQ